MLTRSAQDLRRLRGFTLMELMVVSIVMMLVLLLTTETFTRNQNTHTVIDQVSEIHQNGLALSRLIERDIRQAGYLVAEEAATCGRDLTNGSDVLLLSDADAIRNADELPIDIAGDDLGADVSSFPGGSSGNVPVSQVVIDDQATYDADSGVGGLDSDFRPDGGVIFVNPTATPPVRCGRVTAVNATTDTLAVELVDGIAGFPPTAFDWVAVPAHIYEIVGTQLLRDGSILADDVEDLQIAWFYDGDDDGEVDNGEYLGQTAVDTLNLATLPGADASLLREIRLNLVLRTASDDPNNPTNAGIGQAKENRTGVPGADGRHRRSYRAIARLRNLGV